MYIIEQTIKGRTYVYEVSSYWDKEKKQSRQKRTYLGKKDPKSGKIISTLKSSSVPVNSLSLGGIYLVRTIIHQLQLDKVLKEIFPESYKHILYISSFKLLTGEPLYLYPYWSNTNYLPKESKFESQRISELLFYLGKEEKQVEKFFKRWIELNNESSAVMFDITSISSYSENNDLLEYGYNRDNEQIPQVNLGVISRHSSSCKLPLAYRIYSGDINDVVTLCNILNMMKSYHLSLEVFVLDKGFYSQENIVQMHKKGLKWLIPLPNKLVQTRQLLNQTGEDIDSPVNSFSYNTTHIFNHTKKKFTIKGIPCLAHVYLDKSKQVREEEVYMKKIFEIEHIFKQKNFQNRLEIKDFLEEIVKSKKRFFTIRRSKGKFCLERNEKEINLERLFFGKFIICTNDFSYSAEDVLTLYRSKDGIEKVFLSLKQELGDKRSRTKSESTMRGSLFINFIALIISSHISQIMADKNLFKKFSKTEIFKSLNTLKVFELANSTKLISEYTAKHKQILKAFNISLPKKPSYNSTGF